MPFVNVQTVKGLLNDAQKTELQDRITDLMVEIEGRGDPDFRRYVWVLIADHEPANWQLGGVHLTPAIIDSITARDGTTP